jgi:hypothetical protein
MLHHRDQLEQDKNLDEIESVKTMLDLKMSIVYCLIKNFGFGDGVNFQMSFGVGAFPFGLFQTTFTTNNRDFHYATRLYLNAFASQI